MSNFLEKLATRLTNRREKAVAGFDALVRAIAEDDKSLSHERAEAVLADSGKSMEDLNTAVDRLRSRRQARATLDKALAAPAELARVAAALQLEENKFRLAIKRAEAERAAVVGPLLERQRSLEQQIQDGQRAEQQLRDTAEPAPELADLRSRLAHARRERDRWLSQANKFHQAAGEALTAASAQGYSAGYRDKHLQEAKGKRAGAEQYERDAAPHQEEVRRLEQEIVKVENLALAP